MLSPLVEGPLSLSHPFLCRREDFYGSGGRFGGRHASQRWSGARGGSPAWSLSAQPRHLRLLHSLRITLDALCQKLSLALSYFCKYGRVFIVRMLSIQTHQSVCGVYRTTPASHRCDYGALHLVPWRCCRPSHSRLAGARSSLPEHPRFTSGGSPGFLILPNYSFFFTVFQRHLLTELSPCPCISASDSFVRASVSS